jgi:hypothetical protein
MQALFMNLVPPSSHFFFNSGPKTVLFLSLNVKGDQQTHNKMIPPIMASTGKKSIKQCFHNYLEKLDYGRRSHNFFGLLHYARDEAIIFQLKKLWIRGGHYGFDYAFAKNYAFALWQ